MLRCPHFFNDHYFVDKSGIIETINTRIKTKNRYLCITKPRRRGYYPSKNTTQAPH